MLTLGIEEVTKLIVDIGFPFAVCIGLFKMIQDMRIEYTKQLEKLSEAVNNNTIVMTKIYSRLDTKEDI